MNGSGDAAFLPPAVDDGTAPAARRPRWLAFALTLPLFAIGGAVVGGLGARYGRTWIEPLLQDLPALSWPVLLAAFLLSLWPHVVLHEAGHALAGMARGMRAIAFGIGRLRWDRGQSGWRFRRGARVGGISGFAALVPRPDRGQSRADLALYLLGGPLANLATAALLLALLPLAEGAVWTASILAGLAAGALLFGVVNLLPFQSQGWRSDGRCLLDLLRGAPDATLQQRLQQVMALSMAGVRPRDWPPALVAPADGTSTLLGASNDMLRLSWAMDRGEDVEAAASARRLIAGFRALPDAFRPHCAVTLAGFVARTQPDATALRAWRPLCEGGVTDLSSLRAWLDAELAAADGHPAAARAAIADARARLSQAPDPVTALLLGEYLDALSSRVGA